MNTKEQAGKLIAISIISRHLADELLGIPNKDPTMNDTPVSEEQRPLFDVDTANDNVFANKEEGSHEFSR